MKYRTVRFGTLLSSGYSYNRSARGIYIGPIKYEQLKFLLEIADTVFTAPLDRFKHKEARYGFFVGRYKYPNRHVFTYRYYFIRNLDEANIFVSMGERVFTECLAAGNLYVGEVYDFLLYGYLIFINLENYPFWGFKEKKKLKINRLKIGGLYYLSEKPVKKIRNISLKNKKYLNNILRVIKKRDIMFYLYNDKVKRSRLFLPDEEELIFGTINAEEHKVAERIKEDILNKIRTKYLNQKDFNLDILLLLGQDFLKELLKKQQLALKTDKLKEIEKKETDILNEEDVINEYNCYILRKLKEELVKEGIRQKHEQLKEKKISVNFAENLDLFLKTSSRGEFLRKELRRRCSILLSKYYKHTYVDSYSFDEIAQIRGRKKRWRLKLKARKHIERIGYPIYLRLKIKKIFKLVYLNKSDKIRVLNNLDLVKFKRQFVKKGKAFRRGSRYKKKVVKNRLRRRRRVGR